MVAAGGAAPIFDAFWNGFEDPGSALPTPLDQTPAYVNTVTLAFAGTGPNSSFTTDYLCKHYDAQTIIGWVRTLQASGQRVLMSIIDNEANHWDGVNVPQFVNAATDVIIGDWGLDGIDIDGESGGSSAAIFIELLQELRAVLGPVGGGKYLTYDTYLFSEEDQQILTAVQDELDWVNLMAYFLETEYMIDRFEQYAGLLGPDRVTIGVKPGTGQGDQSTPLGEVAALVKYQPSTGRKKGMMLYSLTMDVPYFTNKPMWTWTKTIHDNLTTVAR